MSDILSQAMQAAQKAEEMTREKDVYLYIVALDRGDFDTMTEIMLRAESDPKLEGLLWQADLAIAEEEHIPPDQVERAQRMVKHLLKQYYEER